jgi:hypothetical protein
MTAVDSSSITLQFFVPTDSGGSDIKSYELHMDQGVVNTDFAEVDSYKTAGGSNASLLTH